MKNIFIVEEFSKASEHKDLKPNMIAFQKSGKAHFQNIETKGDFSFSFDEEEEEVTIKFKLRKSQFFAIGLDKKGMTDQFEV